MGRTGGVARVWKVGADGSRTLLATLEP
jgi:hypothetical protein